MDAIPEGSRCGDNKDVAGDGVSVYDGSDGSGVGSDGSLPLVGDHIEMLAVELILDDGLVLEWVGDAGASARGEDPTTSDVQYDCHWKLHCLNKPQIRCICISSHLSHICLIRSFPFSESSGIGCLPSHE